MAKTSEVILPKGFFQGIKAGIGAEDGPPGRPGMGWDNRGLWACGAHDFHEFFPAYSQGGAAIGGKVPKSSELLGDTARLLRAGSEDQKVHAAHLSLIVPYRRYLRRKQEFRALVFVDSLSCGAKTAYKLLEPLGVGEVAGAQKVDPFELSPPG
jgi:hypothetical protein